VYTIPVSEAAKKQYESAMKLALDDNSVRQTVQHTSPMQKVNMANVSGYYDDEIDSYMSVEQYTKPSNPLTHPTPIHSPPATPPTSTNPDVNAGPAEFKGADSTPFAESMAKFSKEKESAKSNWQYFIDLMLFISAGVLIILLCEIIFKVAATMGMRDTIQMMEPYLAELVELKTKIIELGKESSSSLAA